MGLSMSSGGVLSCWDSSGVVEMASMHPTIMYAMGTHSLGFGDSNNITRVTAKLITMDKLPNTPIVDAGNHVSAKKSSVEAAHDINMASINSGRQ